MVSFPRRARGVKVLKAVSSALRLQILNLLLDKAALSYTELINSLNMNPSRDAGKFAYHLKFLLKADLIEANIETKKYSLTELGKIVIEVTDRIEKKAVRRKRILIRTSHVTLEGFDAHKIVNSLIREANMPAEPAKKVAKEATKRLIKSKTKYLTTSLVREVVNAILIEKGLEEYRHKLTRLGLPVNEVTALVESKAKNVQDSTSIHEKAGERVLKEYTLLNVFPRDIADAHISGSLHISGLSSWILKPSEIMHDLRFFLQNGLILENINIFQPSFSPPQSLESALSITFNVLLHSAREIDRTQTFDYFNIFLAPFVRNLDSTRIKEALRLFILNVNQYANASFGLELTIPKFMAEKKAFGSQGRVVGKYEDLTEESQLLALSILEVLGEESTTKPLFNPKLILKIRDKTFVDERVKAILLEAHKLASEKGILYFVNSLEEETASFSSSGCKLKANLNKDWEIDTIRTGCIGCVAINLPRIAYDCKKDKLKFFQVLKERVELASRALEIKYKTLRQYYKGSIPFIMQSANGDHYFRLENCSRIINLVGFKEAVEAFYEKRNSDARTLEFMEETVQKILGFARKISRKRRKRLLPAVLPDLEASKRLAKLDIEKYGVAKTKFSGKREMPFYSTIRKLTLQDRDISSDLLTIERSLTQLNVGGNFAVIEIEGMKHKPEELMFLTKYLIENQLFHFFTYNLTITYCSNCKKSWSKLMHKCPSCGSIGTLKAFDRFSFS